MSVIILYNRQYIDITNDLTSNVVFENQSRIDDTFAIGSFTAILDIDKNIPPYTIIKINNIQYLCSSSCSKYFSQNKWIHNFTILEPTAILSCYILGSKSFGVTGTNRFDYEKIQIIGNLMKQKYGVEFRFHNGMTEMNKTTEKYTFGVGTTMYDALLEIIKPYNLKIEIPYIATNELDYPIIGINFNPITSDEYIIDNKQILSIEKNQNTDEFCQVLEGEINNVIDDTTLNSAHHLTIRSDDVKLDQDNAYIDLQNKVYKITKFGVEGYIGECDLEFRVPKRFNLGVSTGGTYFKNLTGYTYPIYKNGIAYWSYNVYQEIYDKWFASHMPWESFKEIMFTTFEEGDYIHFQLNSTTKHNSGWFMQQDVSNRLLEKNKWDLLEAKEKTKYCYYKSGESKIENINGYYRDDLWNSLIGNTTYPFLAYANSYRQEIPSKESISFGFGDPENPSDIEEIAYFDYLFIEKTWNKNNAFDYTNQFFIEYYPICNPFISEKKTNTEFSMAKNCARSYGKQVSEVDFDRLMNSFAKTNEFIGEPQINILIDIENYEKPKAGQFIKINNENWYISNIIYNQKNKLHTANLNLVKSYNKTADVIKIESQYESTKNPLNQIIERNIFVELEAENIFNKDDTTDYYAELHFKGKNNFSKYLVKRLSKMVYNNIVYFAFETLDQYAFDKQVSSFSGEVDKESKTVRSCIEIPYCDSNNEFESVELQIVKLKKIGAERSYKLPEYAAEIIDKVYTLSKEILVYKDAYEKLNFTFKIK